MIFKAIHKYVIVHTLLLIFLYSCADDKMNSLKIGDPAPSFQANDQDGNLWRLEDHLNKEILVIYFYPGAMTGGCTKQACGFRNDLSLLNSLNVEVVGISGDPVKNLKLFEQAHNLNFTLLSDVAGEISRNFGVPTKKGSSITREIDGKEVLLIRAFSAARWTFIINQDGKIVAINTEVDAENDSKNVQDLISHIKD
jgi:peroxiredoxin Q/BCP